MRIAALDIGGTSIKPRKWAGGLLGGLKEEGNGGGIGGGEWVGQG